MPGDLQVIDAEPLDLTGLLKPGDRILIAQGPGEPLTLTRLAAAASLSVPGLTFCIGTTISDSLHRCADGTIFESYGKMGSAAQLPPDSVRILPGHYSEYARRFASGSLTADVVMVQLADKADGRPAFLGMGDLFLLDAARHARLVIAEINPATPRSRGTEWPADIPIHIRIRADGLPPSLPSSEPGKTEARIAELTAGLIPDRSVLQFGIGKLPLAITRALRGHRDLGLHTGALTDAVLDLAESGALTNATKEIDRGKSVTSMIMGGPAIWALADDNDDIVLRGTDYTHDPRIISRLSRFTAINSAVEVDLLGQINTELTGGRVVGGIGGQLDFTRGAQLSPAGRSIVVMPATARGGSLSRIMPRVTEVSIPKSDADTVVTEYGIAELRGQSLAERARRMIAVAAPAFREELSREWYDNGRHVYG